MSRVKSVLLVDFDNIYGATSEEVVSGLSNWLLWLEDGAFSPKNRRRRFIDKRVYWNLQFDKYRPEFERAGFSAFNCRALAKRKISAGKSSADIVLTMDAIEIALVNEDVEEFVILTTDSDFVPVVNRVQAGELRVVTCGKETDPTYELFSQYADAAIHISALKAAFGYERAKRKWYALRSPPPEIAPLTLVRERRSPLMGRVRAALETSEAPKDGPAPELLRAAAIIKELGERMPDQPLSKSRIVRALSLIQEFTPTYQAGLRPWFGHKNFAAMMRRLSQIQPAIEVTTLGKNKVETVWREPAEAPPPKPKAPPPAPVDDEPEARLLPRERTPLALLAEAAKDVDLPDPVEDTAEEAPEEDAEAEDSEAEGMTSRV
ncbi:NYN domain-containing protein [Hyphomonas sp. NPDC076900]|uniref:NYN domain-containing protein n=1 Tax=unclassified Hyphomonas TaxID=2630699 RepID=UPI003D0936CA